jgi:predicted RNA-binding protein YlxR (DUF448 family)
MKHIPLRTCAVCRQKDAKRTFVRVVRTPEGMLVVDPTGKRNGRGAYLCRRFSCWEVAAKGTLLDRALRTALPAQFRAELLRYADLHFRRDDDRERRAQPETEHMKEERG